MMAPLTSTGGLDVDEKREKAVADKIQYGKIEAGQIAARYINSGDTVQTTTPGKDDRCGADESEDNTIAKSVKTYNVDTTVGSKKDKGSSQGSISSGELIESVNMTDRRDVWLVAKEGEVEGAGAPASEDEVEGDDMDPPDINRSRGRKSVLEAEEGEEGSVSEWEKTVQEQVRADKEEQERVHEEVVQQWIDHMGRCLGEDNPSGENVVTWMEMVETEMSKTEFLNMSGFVTDEENDFAGVLGDEMQKFIMYFGDEDNSRALNFVIDMKRAVLKKMADIEMESEEEEEETVFEHDEGEGACTSSAAGVTPDTTSKTQGQNSPAEVNTAKEKADRPAGQVIP